MVKKHLKLLNIKYNDYKLNINNTIKLKKLIKSSYYKQVLLYHPDQKENNNHQINNDIDFIEIKKSYDHLLLLLLSNNNNNDNKIKEYSYEEHLYNQFHNYYLNKDYNNCELIFNKIINHNELLIDINIFPKILNLQKNNKLALDFFYNLKNETQLFQTKESLTKAYVKIINFFFYIFI